MLSQKIPLRSIQWAQLTTKTCAISILFACTAVVSTIGASETTDAVASNDATAYYNRAVVEQKNGDLAKALADFNRAIELNPTFTKAYVGRGDIKSDKEDDDGAIADFTRAVELDPKYSMAFAYRANSKVSKKDTEGAMADANRAIELDPKNSFAFFVNGKLKVGERQFRNAIVDLDAAIQLGEKNSDAYAYRGLAHTGLANEVTQADEKRRQHEAAVADYTKSIQIQPVADYFYCRSAEYDQLKQYDKALKDAEEAVGLNPKGASNFYQRGRMYRRAGQESLAIKDFRRALELDPGNKDYADAARPTEERTDSSQLTTGQKIGIGVGVAGAVGGALWWLNKALSHDDNSHEDNPSGGRSTAATPDYWPTPKKSICPICGGSGQVRNYDTSEGGWKTCSMCGGTGYVEK